LCDELRFGFGWIESGSPLRRCSHALAADGEVWILDPLDAPTADDRIRRLGRPVGVIQLLDRHCRDAARFAERFGVPLHRVPSAGVSGSPFEFRKIVSAPFWREVALWWPEERTLVCADALGTAAYFRAPGEPLAVHPLLRLRPPRHLADLEPAHVLVGHGEGIHGPGASSALAEALATARRRAPSWLAALPKEEK
jgi:glyoxylase-like metal-dependent hydrolase (beta-lactamase superfamily II)